MRTHKARDTDEDTEKEIKDAVKAMSDERVRFEAWKARAVRPYSKLAEDCRLIREDAIRNAISIGGDSDTVAAIAGPIAEARFGIPDEIAVAALVGAALIRLVETTWERNHAELDAIVADAIAATGGR